MTETKRAQYLAEFDEAFKDDHVVVDRDCWPAVVVFMRLQNQWERSDFDNSYRCLPIERIKAYLDECRDNWTSRQRAQVVDDLLIMEDEAVLAFAERAQQQRENQQQPPMMAHG